MVVYLNGLESTVIPTKDGYDVVYKNGDYTGRVRYVRYDMDSLLMRGKPIYLMVNADMGNVIDYINTTMELSSEDLIKLQMEIRTHSKKVLDEFVLKMGKSI